jgi:hypothetical protein
MIMTTLQLSAHRRLLVSRARCPGCAEVLKGQALYGGSSCEYCGTSTVLFGISGEDTAKAFRRKSRIHLSLITLMVGIAYMILGWVPLLGSVALLVAGIWIKVGILYPVTATFNIRRRIVTRWSAKMLLAGFIVLTLVICEAMTLTGVFSGFVKAIIGSIQVALAALFVTMYVNWQIGREQRDAPIGWWEWGLLGGSTLTVAGLATASVLVLAALAYAFQYILDTMSTWLF